MPTAEESEDGLTSAAIWARQNKCVNRISNKHVENGASTHCPVTRVGTCLRQFVTTETRENGDSMVMVTLRKITPRPGYKLFLLYNDGVSGEVDLSHLVGQGVFSLWNDPAIFETVTIGEHSAIRWSDNVELCSDALYLQITDKPAEQLFPNLKAKVDA